MAPDLILFFLAVSGNHNLDDRELSKRIRQGDREAYRSFFEAHIDVLFGFLKRRNVPPDDARDIIQNAFITIWERRDDIDENKSLRSYLFRISYTRALNHFRDTAKFAGNTGTELEPSLSDIGDAVPGPDRQADRVILRQAIDRILSGLPEKRRTVFELCFLQELTYREAAEVLGVSIKTVENHMALALKTVREGLEKYR
jgi:RNA polymerase sigma-70 factor, ECF subfamily